jgi:hypothetical protein
LQRVSSAQVRWIGYTVIADLQDWFHESCLNLTRSDLGENEEVPVRPYPQPGQATVLVDETAPPPPQTACLPRETPSAPSSSQRVGEEEDEDDEESNLLLRSEEHDCLICAECVNGNELLLSRAGRPGWMMIVPDQSGGMTVVGRPEPDIARSSETAGAGKEVGRVKLNVEAGVESVADIVGRGVLLTGGKRTRDEGAGEVWPELLKRAKVEGNRPAYNSSETSRKGDVFLSFGEREKLKTELSVSYLPSNQSAWVTYID